MGHTSKIMNRKHLSRGFTLIELMVSVGVLSVLMLIIFQVYMSNSTATQILNAKVKMRDEARIGVSHIVRNLRMADIDSMRYIDGAGDDQDWPPATKATFGLGIIFQRPVDLDGDGNPYSGTAITVDWSGVVTIQLDTADINKDKNTNQVVQLLNGAFVKVLINDVAPLGTDNNGTMYDASSVGGFWIAAPDPTGDPNLVQIRLLQRRTLENGQSSVITYYEDFVRVRNDTSDDS